LTGKNVAINYIVEINIHFVKWDILNTQNLELKKGNFEGIISEF